MSLLDKYTQSLYCPSASLVVPFAEDLPENPLEPTADVTLELAADGNQYLHLVLPADRINFLNGLGAGKSFFDEDPTMDAQYEGGDQMMIEVGCKVFEVNRVAIRPPSSIDVKYDFTA